MSHQGPYGHMEAQPVPSIVQRGPHVLQAADVGTSRAAEATQHAHSASAPDQAGLPTLETLLGHSDMKPAHPADTSSCRKPGKHQSVDASLTAALGGLLALSGSVLSYALARARSGKRVRSLKAGLHEKEQALQVTQKELQQAQKQVASLKAAAAKRANLERELTASRSNLEAMTSELEAARAASRKIESDFATIQDQLQGHMASSQQQVAEARAAAEQRVVDADKARQDAEQRWQKAYADLDAAQNELEAVKGELGVRGSQLEALTRELEMARKQLAASEKRVERAMTESRSARAGYSGEEYDAWD